jgi:hypothetical protein
MIGDSELRHTEALIRRSLTEEDLNRQPANSLRLAVEEATPIQVSSQYFSVLLSVLFHKRPIYHRRFDLST